MEPVAHITGFDLGLGTNPTSSVVTISICSGSILWPPGQVQTVHPCSISVSKQQGARRVRVYLRKASQDPFDFGHAGFVPAIDGDEATPRGYYSDALVVIGHVEVPAAPASTNADKPLDTRERTNLLRIIRALSVMAKLPDRGATTSVEKQLQKLGFSGPKDATIRSALADARALEPDG